jgi:hypothetical protein
MVEMKNENKNVGAGLVLVDGARAPTGTPASFNRYGRVEEARTRDGGASSC